MSAPKWTTVEELLAEHPEVQVGRDALAKEEEKHKENLDTFHMFNKPLPNVVLVQVFHADTNQRLYAVALVDDAKAEEYYQRVFAPSKEQLARQAKHEEECAECRETPEQFLYEVARPRIPQCQ